MTLKDEATTDLIAPVSAPVPWFYRRAPLSEMHHVEIVTRLEGGRVEQLEELFNAAAAVDGHEPIGEHKFLHMKRGNDLAVGYMAYEGERLVGYAHTLAFGSGEERRVSCEIVVHPEHRRHGIGRALLSYVINHAEEEGARRLDLWAYSDSPGSRRTAEGVGARVTRKLLHMHRHPGPPLALAPPVGTNIRPFRPGEDDELWLDMNNRVFAGHPENGNWTLEDLRARVSQPWFREQDLLILEVDGKPAGFHWLKVERRGDELMGEVYIMGTLPEYHGRGLGRYLLGEGLRHLSERGVDAVAVYVDQSNERAVALYWAFEFHHHHVDVLYSLQLPIGSVEAATAAVAG